MNVSRLPHVSGRFRVNCCALLGAAVGAAVVPFVPWQLAVLIGWGVLCVALLTWVWVEIGPCDATHTERLSTIEDPTHSTSVVVMVTASVMSLVGVAEGLAKAREEDGGLQMALTVGAILAVVLSWLVVHSMFTLRYAHEYYITPVGGIAFPGGEAPDYLDFAYFAFTVGMAFAVSDAVVASRNIRRVTLRHALVSYLFGAVIVGLTINVMAGFIR
ncbi:MAG: DUF1345 domain-containing protein [Actinomycetota bacterium]|nr:DUF1345 domain-containing protein [Actinomycetota bacterium]